MPPRLDPPPIPVSGKPAEAGRWLELLLTLAVVGLLVAAAAPLALPGAEFGLAGRYGSPGGTQASWRGVLDLFGNYTWTAVPQDLRAVTMLRFGGCGLALLGCTGWAALQLARTQAAWAGWLMLALWAALAWVLRPFQLPGIFWACCAALALAACLLALALVARRRQTSDTAPINAWTACVWPGWLLLAGMGCLVWLDFAARGPVVPGGMDVRPIKPGVRYFGLNQADGLWLASGLLLGCAFLRGAITRGVVLLCTVLGALWQRPRGPWVLLPLALAAMLAIGWLGASEHRDFLGFTGLHGAGRPHISGEVLRLGICVVLAWFAYRTGEWRVSAQRAWGSLHHLLIVLALCMAGLMVSDDKGPLLVLALAICVLVGAPVLQRVGGGRSQGWQSWLRRGAAVMLATGLAVAALGMWRTTLTDWLPRISKDAAARESMRATPFEARSPNLAQARWLMDATPTGGFGLARVPYCGARAHAGQAPCTLGSGAPLQMPSDFAYVPLFATWGAAGATALVMGLLAWLFVLPAGLLAARRSGATPDAADPLGLLPVWLVTVPALVAQAQTMVSVGATLGWSSLTGVTMPLLGYGTASLCAAALAVGMAAHSGKGNA